ncbi:dnaJ subfamily C member 13-like [Carpediemonas membranifera]|uniref:DnaJ subfamily C member 13-like n=1 Tax=Carpediemonas membranifera TaxID=201153 RepID=A0A8J6AZI1_9EUKA|nr:dnaJ subfamily C member 13-like [Carpediemonas membranifera]|eukprot:KAG9396095.1 dnaJ subfamily C member 13-like [Carpediemonas membranifera]
MRESQSNATKKRRISQRHWAYTQEADAGSGAQGVSRFGAISPLKFSHTTNKMGTKKGKELPDSRASGHIQSVKDLRLSTSPMSPEAESPEDLTSTFQLSKALKKSLTSIKKCKEPIPVLQELCGLLKQDEYWDLKDTKLFPTLMDMLKSAKPEEDVAAPLLDTIIRCLNNPSMLKLLETTKVKFIDTLLPYIGHEPTKHDAVAIIMRAFNPVCVPNDQTRLKATLAAQLLEVLPSFAEDEDTFIRVIPEIVDLSDYELCHAVLMILNTMRAKLFEMTESDDEEAKAAALHALTIPLFAMPLAEVEALQLSTLATGSFVHILHDALETTPVGEAARTTLGLLVDGNEKVKSVLSRLLPAAIVQTADPNWSGADFEAPPEDLQPVPPADQKEAKRLKKTLRGEVLEAFVESGLAVPLARGNWARMWYYFDSAVESPTLVWNDAIRAEHRAALEAELEDLDFQRAQGHTWDYGSLDLDIPSLSGPFVGPYIIGRLLETMTSEPAFRVVAVNQVVNDTWRLLTTNCVGKTVSICLMAQLLRTNAAETLQVLRPLNAGHFLATLVEPKGPWTPAALDLIEAIFDGRYVSSASRFVRAGLAKRLLECIEENPAAVTKTIAHLTASAPRCIGQLTDKAHLGLLSDGIAVCDASAFELLAVLAAASRKPTDVESLVATGAHLFGLASLTDGSEAIPSYLTAVGDACHRLGVPSPLATVLPTSMLRLLARDHAKFVDTLVGSTDIFRADLIWTSEEREALGDVVDSIIGNFASSGLTTIDFLAGKLTEPLDRDGLYPGLAARAQLAGLYLDIFNNDPSVDLDDGVLIADTLAADLVSAVTADIDVAVVVAGYKALSGLLRYISAAPVAAINAGLAARFSKIAIEAARLCRSTVQLDNFIQPVATQCLAAIQTVLARSVWGDTSNVIVPIAAVVSQLVSAAGGVGAGHVPFAQTVVDATVGICLPNRAASIADGAGAGQAVRNLMSATNTLIENSEALTKSAIAKGVPVAALYAATSTGEEDVEYRATVLRPIAQMMAHTEVSQFMTSCLGEGMVLIAKEPENLAKSLVDSDLIHPRRVWSHTMLERVHETLAVTLGSAPDYYKAGEDWELPYSEVSIDHPELEGEICIEGIYLRCYVAHPELLMPTEEEGERLARALVTTAIENNKPDFAPAAGSVHPVATMLTALRQLWDDGFGKARVDLTLLLDLVLDAAPTSPETLATAIKTGAVTDVSPLRTRMWPVLLSSDRLATIRQLSGAIAEICRTDGCEAIMLDQGLLLPYLWAATAHGSAELWLPTVIVAKELKTKVLPIFTHLFAPRIADAMVTEKPDEERAREVNSLFQADTFEPNHIWNDGCREEIKTFFDTAATEARNAGAKFKWAWKKLAKAYPRESLAKELCIDGIFLRAFNESPLFEVNPTELLGEMEAQLRTDDSLLVDACKSNDSTYLDLTQRMATTLQSINIVYRENQHLLSTAWSVLDLVIKVALNSSIATGSTDVLQSTASLSGMWAIRKNALALLSNMAVETSLAQQILKHGAVRNLLSLLSVLTGEDLVTAVEIIRSLVSKLPPLATQATRAGAPVFLLSVALSPHLDRSRRLHDTEVLALMYKKSDEMKTILKELLTADAEAVFQKSASAVLAFLEDADGKPGPDSWNRQRADRLIIALRRPLQELVFYGKPWKGDSLWTPSTVVKELVWTDEYEFKVLSPQPYQSDDEEQEDGVSEISDATPRE